MDNDDIIAELKHIKETLQTSRNVINGIIKQIEKNKVKV